MVKKYLKLLLRWSLVLAIAFHIGPVLIWLFGLAGYLNAGNSFIGSVNTPSYQHTSEYLAELNLRGYGEVVKLHGWRPIFIMEDNLNKVERYHTDEKGRKNYYSILGVTWPTPAYCLIIMDSDLDEETYRLTLWHEYLHCFYYGHSEKPRDIMAAMNGYVHEDSVDYYLKELKELYD